MKNDTNGAWKWTACLPDGKRVRLDVAEGVRLCVGDVLWIGGALYNVVKRQMDEQGTGWRLVVRKGSGMSVAERPTSARRHRMAN